MCTGADESCPQCDSISNKYSTETDTRAEYIRSISLFALLVQLIERDWVREMYATIHGHLAFIFWSPNDRRCPVDTLIRMNHCCVLCALSGPLSLLEICIKADVPCIYHRHRYPVVERSTYARAKILQKLATEWRFIRSQTHTNTLFAK